MIFHLLWDVIAHSLLPRSSWYHRRLYPLLKGVVWSFTHFNCVLRSAYLQDFVFLESFYTLSMGYFSSKRHKKYQVHFMNFACCCLLFVLHVRPWFAQAALWELWCAGRHKFPVFANIAMPNSSPSHFLVCCTTRKSMSQMQTVPGLDEKMIRWSEKWVAWSHSVPQINQWNGLSLVVSVKLFQTALKCHQFHSCWH